MACDAEDCGFQMLHDDEIVISVQEEYYSVGDEMDEDENNNNESSKGSSNADQFSALQAAMERSFIQEVQPLTPIIQFTGNIFDIPFHSQELSRVPVSLD
ncbi:hypothetical protein TNCV_1462901 [Trichonephila clavipes]|uniref:Uncharacterized protein n=1 Tax=Trichonephila clavipes TaxID=2585209 RepID=A0A8X6VLA5_TRICX|nr:hypothetical protein TNCV_1462901 [Trichonephila clavipes]